MFPRVPEDLDSETSSYPISNPYDMSLTQVFSGTTGTWFSTTVKEEETSHIKVPSHLELLKEEKQKKRRTLSFFNKDTSQSTDSPARFKPKPPTSLSVTTKSNHTSSEKSPLESLSHYLAHPFRQHTSESLTLTSENHFSDKSKRRTLSIFGSHQTRTPLQQKPAPAQNNQWAKTILGFNADGSIHHSPANPAPMQTPARKSLIYEPQQRQQSIRVAPPPPEKPTSSRSTFQTMLGQAFKWCTSSSPQTKQIAQNVTQSLLADRRLDPMTAEHLKDEKVVAEVVSIMKTLDEKEIGTIRKLVIKDKRTKGILLKGLFPQAPGTNTVASTRGMTVQSFWWGYTVQVSPVGLRQLQSAGNVTTSSLSMITALATSIPVLAAYSPVIASYIGLQFALLSMLDKGFGVTLTACWVLPVFFIPTSTPDPNSADA